MRILLLDTSAAIALGEMAGRSDLFDLLAKLGRLEVPRQVMEELGAKPQNVSHHLHPIEIDDEILGHLKTRYPTLGAGELAVLARATVLGDEATCVLDDRRARQVAAANGFPLTGTWGLLLELEAAEHLSRDEAENIVANLRAAGFRLPPEDQLAEARRVLDP